ncbi:hypothetical protein [Nonomuraea dietziae]
MTRSNMNAIPSGSTIAKTSSVLSFERRRRSWARMSSIARMVSPSALGL